MDKNWLVEKYIAHRGLFNNKDIPENSIVAFEQAIVNDFGIELDIQMTTDGVLVVFHDDDMERLTGVKGDIREKTFEDIKDLTLLGTQHKIPTFSEFLNCIDGRTQLVIEIKTHKKVGGVEQKILNELKNYKGEYVFESFNPFIVRWFKKHAPNIIRGQLAQDMKGLKMSRLGKRMLTNLKFCKWNGSQFIAYNVMDVKDSKAVHKWRKKVPVIVWTVKSQTQYDETKQFYDNMIFDSFVPQRGKNNE